MQSDRPVVAGSDDRSVAVGSDGITQRDAAAPAVGLDGGRTAAVDAVIASLRARQPRPALVVPKPWVPWDADIQRRLVAGDLAAAPVKLRTGLMLWNDALGESHVLSQGIADADGAYWHGIMHRREGDLDNAAHWFRRVGAHPAFSAVQAAAVAIAREAGLGGNTWAADLATDLVARPWDPHRFIALCAAARETPGPHPVLERIQVAEIECLLGLVTMR